MTTETMNGRAMTKHAARIRKIADRARQVARALTAGRLVSPDEALTESMQNELSAIRRGRARAEWTRDAVAALEEWEAALRNYQARNRDVSGGADEAP